MKPIFSSQYRTFYSLSLFFLSCCHCFAQTKDTVINISGELYQPLYKICREAAVDFPINWGFQYASTANPKTTFYRVLGSKEENTCRLELIETIYDNNTLQLEGGGINVISKEQGLPNNTWHYNVKFSSTGTPTVSWKERVNYTSNNCGYESKETTYIGTYQKIISIPTPPIPILTSLKAVVRFGESTTITSSGCPNTLEGETEYPYNYGVKATQDWLYDCSPAPTPYYREDSPKSYLPYENGLPYYRPGFVVRARCNDNRCISSDSAPIGLTIRKKDQDCYLSTEYADIENVGRTSDKSYHHYMIETTICNTSNPNCTVSNVFNLMKDNVQYSSPIPTDMDLTGATTALGSVSIKAPVLLSELVSDVNTGASVNCINVNLPSALAIIQNLVNLFTDPGAYLISRFSNQQNLLANPIFQYIDEDTKTITNYTKKGHILYPGKIIRTVVENCGQVKLITIGTGTNQAGDNDAGKGMSLMNVNVGSIMFKHVDQRLGQEFDRLYK